jgi:hypothetical protein
LEAIGDVPERRALRDSPFLPYDLSNPVEFLGHPLIDTDDLVKGVGNLSWQSRPVVW